MNNVVPFRGRVATAASRLAAIRAERRSRSASRPVLVALWRPNPVSGRLECRWIVEDETSLDEGASRRRLGLAA